jgi:ATP/maltotriose-dependent transcriptional regulator MalT
MTTELPLLRTKISIPRIRAVVVRRPRLTDQFYQGVMGLLMLPVTPAGFGKANLLAERAAERASTPTISMPSSM